MFMSVLMLYFARFNTSHRTSRVVRTVVVCAFMPAPLFSQLSSWTLEATLGHGASFAGALPCCTITRRLACRWECAAPATAGLVSLQPPAPCC